MQKGPSSVDQIKQKLSIVDVIGGYIKLQRAGVHMRARCPFHAEKTPSFHVSPDRGTYHCFGCGVGGDMFSFVQAIEGLDFKGALKVLADKAGVELVFDRGASEASDERDQLLKLVETATLYFQSQMTPEAKKYLHDRGITDDTITQFRIGWAGASWDALSKHLLSKKYTDTQMVEAGLAKKNDRGLTDKFRNRIMFPINDSAGRPVAFSGRIFGADASPEAPKYLNSPETPLFTKSNILYGFDKAKLAMRKLQCAVLVEGQVDLVMSHQAGWANTVAVSGTAFTENHAKLIQRMTDNLIIALDADEAGLKATARSARVALVAGLNVKVVHLKTKDPADLILQDGPDAWKLAIKEAKDIIAFLLDVLQEKMPERDKFRRAVEAVVLPFIADVKSPIAREQYVSDVAARLGVSSVAVIESVNRVPQAIVPQSDDTPAAYQKESKPKDQIPTKSSTLYALLLGQRGLPKPVIPLEELTSAVTDAMGEEVFAELEKLSESEKEHMKFSVERLYTNGVTKKELESMTRVAHVERLMRELKQTSKMLETAEKAQNEAEIERLLQASKLLTGRIAQLKKM